MCEICHSTPCRPQCPNAEDTPAYWCEKCNAGIYGGDAYYDIEGEIICENCIGKYKHEVTA